MQCTECDGWGHSREWCGTFIKNNTAMSGHVIMNTMLTECRKVVIDTLPDVRYVSYRHLPCQPYLRKRKAKGESKIAAANKKSRQE